MGHPSIYKLFDFIKGSDRNKQKIRVLIYGLPKSGTSLLTYMIASSISGHVKIEFEPSFRNKNTELYGSVVTKCLYGFDGLITPKKIVEWDEFEKKIWIARDPRDIIISEFLYIWYWRHNPDKKNFKRAFKKLCDKERDIKSIPFHELEFFRHTGKIWTQKELAGFHKARLKSMCEFVKSINDSWFIYKYEDLVDRNLEGLSNYLQITLKDNVSVPSKFSRVVRSKSYSNWKDWFTQEDVDFYKPLMRVYLDLIGYDSDDWNLNPDQKLKPNIGSQYMRNLHYNSNA